jgi:hypothetical protein
MRCVAHLDPPRTGPGAGEDSMDRAAHLQVAMRAFANRDSMDGPRPLHRRTNVSLQAIREGVGATRERLASLMTTRRLLCV